MLLLHRALLDTQGLGHRLQLVKLKLLPLGLEAGPMRGLSLLTNQRTALLPGPALTEGVPDDPGDLGDAGLGLLPQCRHPDN